MENNVSPESYTITDLISAVQAIEKELPEDPHLGTLTSLLHDIKHNDAASIPQKLEEIHAWNNEFRKIKARYVVQNADHANLFELLKKAEDIANSLRNSNSGQHECFELLSNAYNVGQFKCFARIENYFHLRRPFELRNLALKNRGLEKWCMPLP
ncbi:MAG: hypothetical protein ABIH83_02555 [Candidatus Micrarchaeota archaeon]